VRSSAEQTVKQTSEELTAGTYTMTSRLLSGRYLRSKYGVVYVTREPDEHRFTASVIRISNVRFKLDSE